MTVTLDREDMSAPPPTMATDPAAEVATDTHTMHVINRCGGATTVSWIVGQPCEAAAAQTFAACKAAGYLTYATRAPGEHEVLHEFDASAPHIVATRPVQGG